MAMWTALVSFRRKKNIATSSDVDATMQEIKGVDLSSVLAYVIILLCAHEQ